MLIKTININNNFQIGIWQIDEAESFFTDNLPQHFLQLSAIKNHTKRLEHCASRYLAAYLLSDFKTSIIQKDTYGKPFFSNFINKKISISHTNNLAVVAINAHFEIGVDIEKPSFRILQLAQRFFSDEEKLICNQQLDSEIQRMQYATKIWCAKEAIFKKYVINGINFSDINIQLNSDSATTKFIYKNDEFTCELMFDSIGEYILAIAL